jgi:hypothetical protein
MAHLEMNVMDSFQQDTITGPSEPVIFSRPNNQFLEYDYNDMVKKEIEA